MSIQSPTSPPLAEQSGSLLARIVPLPAMSASRASLMVERSLLVFKHGWLLIVSGFFEPLFYLLSIGIGIGALVGTISLDGRVVGYTAFVAPALLASSAMNGAVYDSTVNVFFKLKYAKLYDSMLSTSLGPLDVALGEIGWALTRGGMYATTFVLVMVVMGLITSWWGLLLIPAALLVAFAFAALGMGATTYKKSFQDLDYIQLAVLPMFLFSGTFFDISTYPTAVRWLVEILPLHHGVALLRGLSLGAVDLSLLGHVAYFLVMAAIGLWITTRRLTRLLLT